MFRRIDERVKSLAGCPPICCSTVIHNVIFSVRLIEAIILGLVQGLPEFLPVFSSAHLRILGEFLPSATDPGATFTAITQIGTEAAVLLLLPARHHSPHGSMVPFIGRRCTF